MTKPHILTFETYDDWDIGPMEAEYTVFNLPYGAHLDTLPQHAFETIEAFAFRGHGSRFCVSRSWQSERKHHGCLSQTWHDRQLRRGL